MLSPKPLEIRFYALKDWKSRLLSLLGGTRFNHVDLKVGDLVLGIYHPKKIRLDLDSTVSKVIQPEVVYTLEGVNLPQVSMVDLFQDWVDLLEEYRPSWIRLFLKRWFRFPVDNSAHCVSLIQWTLGAVVWSYNADLPIIPLYTPDQLNEIFHVRMGAHQGTPKCPQGPLGSGSPCLPARSIRP